MNHQSFLFMQSSLTSIFNNLFLSFNGLYININEFSNYEEAINDLIYQIKNQTNPISNINKSSNSSINKENKHDDMSSSFVDDIGNGFETIDSNLTFELGNENYVDYNTITLSLSTTTSQNSTPSSKDSTNEPNKQNYSLNKSNKKLKFHNIKNPDFEDDLPNYKILSYQNSNNKKNNLKIKNFHKIDSNQNNLINKRKFDELNNSKKNKYLQSLITEQQTVFNYMSGK